MRSSSQLIPFVLYKDKTAFLKFFFVKESTSNAISKLLCNKISLNQTLLI